MTDHSTILRGRHSEVARDALRSAPSIFRGLALRLHERQRRQGMPRPGATVRKFMEGVALPCGAYLSMVKERLKDGGDIVLVVAWKSEVTLAGRQLRLLRARLPDTVAAAMTGKRVRDAIDVSACGILSRLGDARVREVVEDQGHQVLILDLPHIEISIGDACADAREAGMASREARHG